VRAFKSVFLILPFVAAAAVAQPPGPRPGGPMDIERLAILLDLDAYQKNEVERVLKEQRDATLAAREARAAEGAESLSFDDMRARRAALEQETLTKLSAVLTEPQMTKFKVLTERPDRARGPRFQPPVEQ
jgi:hypothetical protein